MKENIAALIKVKSIVTLALTGALVAMLFAPVEPSKEILTLFCTAYGSIITYFFMKKGDQND